MICAHFEIDCVPPAGLLGHAPGQFGDPPAAPGRGTPLQPELAAGTDRHPAHAKRHAAISFDFDADLRQRSGATSTSQ